MIWFLLYVFLPFTADGLTLIEEADKILQEKAIKSFNKKQLEEAALKGLAGSLDPYSAYLNPEETKNWYQSLENHFFGLAIEIVKVRQGALITDLYEGGPAFQFGLKRDDIIIEVADQIIKDQDLQRIKNLITAQKPSFLKIKILRDGKEETFSIKRALVKIKPLVKKFGKSLYIRIKSFHKNLATDLEKILLTETFQSLVLDLRFNPGGLLEEAVATAELFLDKDQLLTVLKEKNRIERVFSKKRDLIKGKNLVILINSLSASGAELVAAALQDHKRALLVGEKSFGKASVQSHIKMTQGLLKITTGLYFSPKGQIIDQKGLEPDLLVVSSENFSQRDLGTSSDLQLTRALDLLLVKDFYQDIRDAQPPE